MLRPLLAIAASIMLLAPATLAQANEPVLLAQNRSDIPKVFNDLERRVIREVLGAAGIETGEQADDRGGKGKGAKGAPPGLAKRDRLPPGLQMQLERNGRLPPGLEKRQFPAHLRAQLPSPLQGTERLIVGNDAVLVEIGTNIILDIIRDVVRQR